MPAKYYDERGGICPINPDFVRWDLVEAGKVKPEIDDDAAEKNTYQATGSHSINESNERPTKRAKLVGEKSKPNRKHRNAQVFSL